MKKTPDVIKIAARKLRKNQTEAESLVWNILQNRRLGIKFQRQFPIYIFSEDTGHDRYIIADFYCSERKIILEIDGNIHDNEDIYLLDRYKEQLLQNQGYKIIRITNSTVLEAGNKLKEIISEKCTLQPFSLEKRKDSDMSLRPADSRREDINSGKSLGSVDSRKENTNSDMSSGSVNPESKKTDSKKFTMINTSFTCENCNFEVSKHPTGSARNHCPNCLCSKHLDQDFPGDRLSACYGLMKPVGLDYKKNKGLMLKHLCETCGKEILNKIAPDDNQELIRKL